MFASLKQDIDNLILNITELTYFMRGAIQYDDMFDMCFLERQKVSEFIEKRLEVEKKKPPSQQY